LSTTKIETGALTYYVAKEFQSVVENLKDLAIAYKEGKGVDPRITYYQGIKGL